MEIKVGFLAPSLEALCRASRRCTPEESMDDTANRIIRYGLRCYEAIVAGGQVYMLVPVLPALRRLGLEREIEMSLPDEPLAGITLSRLNQLVNALVDRRGALAPERPGPALPSTLCLDNDLFGEVTRFAERYTGTVTLACNWLVQLGERVDSVRRGQRPMYRRMPSGEVIVVRLD